MIKELRMVHLASRKKKQGATKHMTKISIEIHQQWSCFSSVKDMGVKVSLHSMKFDCDIVGNRLGMLPRELI